MIHSCSRKKKGFTLVELMVVIAILAILVAVIIPSFTRYIDRSRFSNDVQKAASMTSVIQGYQVEHNAILDAYDVQTIIEEHHGEPFDFTPTASDTGFFYLAANDTVVAAKYEDAEELFEALNRTSHVLLSESMIENETSFNTPAEIFGSGNHLLTREGSAVAYAVDFVYRLASTGSALDAFYEEGEKTLEDYTSAGILKKIMDMLGFGMSEELKEKLTELLDYYDPKTTLYVNDGYWATTAGNGSDINKIVFAPGIRNIPSFVEEIENIDIEKVVLPTTINSIEAGAFGDAFNIGEVVITSEAELKVEAGAFKDGLTVSKATTAFDRNSPEYEIGSVSDPLITYDDSIEESLTLDLKEVKAYFDGLGIRVTSYSVDLYLSDLDVTDVNDLKSKVYIFTKDGYLGYVIPVPEA
jgi:prepilin-type N-terminal cleavage/methylation domain-containing protein